MSVTIAGGPSLFLSASRQAHRRPLSDVRCLLVEVVDGRGASLVDIAVRCASLRHICGRIDSAIVYSPRYDDAA
jgi:hypothetical protein